MKTKKYCYKEVDFPKHGFIGYIYATNNQDISILYPLPQLCKHHEDIAREALSIIKTRKDLFIPPEVIVIPAQLHKLYPLKKIYWENPVEKYDLLERSRSFLKPLKNFNFYELLVTPWFQKNQITFAAGVCFSIGADYHEIESFMLHSNMPVDIKAKNAALYTFERPFCYELTNKKIIPVLNPILTEKTLVKN